MGNQIVPTSTAQYKQLKDLLTNDQVRARFQAMLDENAGAFMGALLNLVANDAKLAQCDPGSILIAASTAAALRLAVDKSLGQAWIIPYQDHKRGGAYFASFQPGYKGYIQLAHRTGEYLKLNVAEIYQGEQVIIDRITGDTRLNGKRTGDEIVGYVGYFKLRSGFEKAVYWPVEKLNAHGLRYSKTVDKANGKFYDSSLWLSNPDAMYRKTVIANLLSKWGYMSIDIRRALKSDDAIEVEYHEVEQERLTGEQIAALPDATTEQQPDFAPDNVDMTGPIKTAQVTDEQGRLI